MLSSRVGEPPSGPPGLDLPPCILHPLVLPTNSCPNPCPSLSASLSSFETVLEFPGGEHSFSKAPLVERDGAGLVPIHVRDGPIYILRLQ